jgi:prevent-host-death family protein
VFVILYDERAQLNLQAFDRDGHPAQGRQEHEGDPMKVVALGKAKNSLSEYVNQAQHGWVLVTRHGKPAALIIGVEGEDFEDLMTRSDPQFWRMIESRRTESTIPAREMRKRLGIPKKPTSKRIGVKGRPAADGRSRGRSRRR